MSIGLFFHLGGDIDMLAPFLTRLGEGDVAAEKIIVAAPLLLGNPRLSTLLGAYGRKPDAILPQDATEQLLRVALAGCRSLLTASETTLRPHRLAHALANTANQLGIITATLQHGIENVGITYFDEHQGPEVGFASSHVLTWAGKNSLQEGVRGATTDKVRDAGLPGPPDDTVFAPWRDRLDLPHGGRKIVGVFENLHWTRFSDDYRAQFLSDLQYATLMFPDLFFLLKPHPEGRWLTERFSGPRPAAKNLLVASPTAPVWNMLTAPYLMPALSAIITTPSKVALDAAIAGVPAAVASYSCVFPRYKDLPTLAALRDWESFLENIRHSNTAGYESANQKMLNSTVSSIGTQGAIRLWLNSPHFERPSDALKTAT
ncbi:MAG: hypothetical protein ACK4NV_07515 [Pannonibacter sp.]